MRMALAVSVGVVLALSACGAAAAANLIQIRGRIDVVDCASRTLVLRTPRGAEPVALAAGAPVTLNTFPVDLCTLRPLAGSFAVAWMASEGNQMRAARVDAFSAASTVAPPPAYYPCCPLYPGFAGFPGIGIGSFPGFGIGVGFEWRPGARSGWDDH
jgi:hypothetical protein